MTSIFYNIENKIKFLDEDYLFYDFKIGIIYNKRINH